MFRDIMVAISIAFIFIGVLSVLNYILLKILMPKKGGSYVLIVPPDSSGGDVAGLVYNLALKFGVFGLFKNIKIKVVDCGMSEDAKEMCDVLQKQSENIEVCNCNEIFEDIENTRFTKEES